MNSIWIFILQPTVCFMCIIWNFRVCRLFTAVESIYGRKNAPDHSVWNVCKNTLVLFMQNAGKACDDLHVFLQQLSPEGQKITTEIREENYSSLKTLLTQVTGKLLRYSMIYYINHFHITAICNYNWVIDQIRVLYQQIQEGNREKTDQAVELLNSIDNIDF